MPKRNILKLVILTMFYSIAAHADQKCFWLEVRDEETGKTSSSCLKKPEIQVGDLLNFNCRTGTDSRFYDTGAFNVNATMNVRGRPSGTMESKSAQGRFEIERDDYWDAYSVMIEHWNPTSGTQISFWTRETSFSCEGSQIPCITDAWYTGCGSFRIIR